MDIEHNNLFLLCYCVSFDILQLLLTGHPISSSGVITNIDRETNKCTRKLNLLALLARKVENKVSDLQINTEYLRFPHWPSSSMQVWHLITGCHLCVGSTPTRDNAEGRSQYDAGY